MICPCLVYKFTQRRRLDVWRLRHKEKDPFCLLIKKQNKRIPADLSRSEEKDDRIRGREEKMKETGRIKLKEIPFSRTFETGNGEELCNATGYAVQFDNEKNTFRFSIVLE